MKQACEIAAAPLEGFAPDEWVCFERALVVRDIFTGGTRTWLSHEDAQTFRRDIYKIYGKPHITQVLVALPRSEGRVRARAVKIGQVTWQEQKPFLRKSVIFMGGMIETNRQGALGMFM